ncbi:hypothetical protein WOLCODRAFT_140323 [Wolfiporia cocos MD-104 SS10]|uniref:DUF1772-domain-containing protein n=1 Tax=Wolfiporia cocos (strain MD-104) TaxID=742152 RepID=A0A2H3J2U5_WOLCO|nr:hypothetical protein WOLCODRAFT_140323 [Wolfiporia cocos MD-104 SS10]
MTDLQSIARVTGPVAAGLFAGLSAGYNISIWPAIWQVSELSPANLLRLQDELYKRGARIMPVISGLSTVGYLVSASYLPAGRRTPRLLSAVLIAMVVPWTFGTMMSLNKRIGRKAKESVSRGENKDGTVDIQEAEAHEMIGKWLKLHAVRSVLSLGAFVLGVADLAGLV